MHIENSQISFTISYRVNDVSAPSVTGLPFLNHLLGRDLCKNFFDFYIFSFFGL